MTSDLYDIIERLRLLDPRLEPLCDELTEWARGKAAPPVTLEAAKAAAREAARRPGGTSCPLCTKHVQVYRRSISAGMAAVLIWLHTRRVTRPVVSSQDIARRGWSGASDYAKLRWWGLIRRVGEPRTGTKNSDGLWAITEKGSTFVRGEVDVPKYVDEYRSKVIAGPYGEEVSIHDALRNKFDYEELMNG